MPQPLARRFEAIVFDWDGTAVPDRARRRDAAARPRRGRRARPGLELAVVSGTHVGNVDGQLAARPSGPGALTLLLNRGSEVFRVERAGPRARWSAAPPAAHEDAALSRAAQLTVERLAARGLTAADRLVAAESPQDRPHPRAALGRPAQGAHRRAARGRPGSPRSGRHRGPRRGGRDRASAAATEAGLPDPRVTSDAKHVEIGLTDKSDSTRWIMRELWRRGIAPGQVLIAGDELGTLGGLPGSDSMLLASAARRATALSVGVEPAGVPAGVIALGGGPAAFAAVLERSARPPQRRRAPAVDRDPCWTLAVDGRRPAARACARIAADALRRPPRHARQRRGRPIPPTRPVSCSSGVYTGRAETRPAAGAAVERDRVTRARAAGRRCACSTCTPASCARN